MSSTQQGPKGLSENKGKERCFRSIPTQAFLWFYHMYTIMKTLELLFLHECFQTLWTVNENFIYLSSITKLCHRVNTWKCSCRSSIFFPNTHIKHCFKSNSQQNLHFNQLTPEESSLHLIINSYKAQTVQLVGLLLITSLIYSSYESKAIENCMVEIQE